jgi:hypothetical protein
MLMSFFFTKKMTLSDFFSTAYRNMFKDDFFLRSNHQQKIVFLLVEEVIQIIAAIMSSFLLGKKYFLKSMQ